MIRRALLLGVLFGLGPQTSLWGDIINVPGDQPSIQAAIDAAADGDEIVVAPGRYFENINLLGKAITLRSSNGPEVTTIDANGSGTVVRCGSGEGPNTVIDGFTITGGLATDGGGMHNSDASPTVTNCVFSHNGASFGGGGMYNSFSSPTVINCAFSGNSAKAGGGMATIFSINLRVINCTFSGNTAGGTDKHGRPIGWGGGMFNSASSNLSVTNCTFSGNHADGFGGGISNSFSGSATITNCTFRGNSASSGGGMHNSYGDDPAVINCVLWNNIPNEIAGPGTPTVTYSDVQGGWPGEGNIDADPLFVDPDGPDDDPETFDDNDYRLAAGSPAIDAADSGAVPLCILDLDGNERLVDDPATEDSGAGGPPVVDMGAYEFGSPPLPDCNGNGLFDDCDIAEGTSQDCNGNGVPDECSDVEDDCTNNGVPDECEPDCNENGVADSCDIADGISADCTGNGLPDECEPDCNDNGVADSCDIADGTSTDCTGNGLPDECEPDCNENGVPDSCDILDGTSADCDGNFVPDECQDTTADCNDNGIWDACDLDQGTSPDRDGNGIPDECEENEVLYVDDDAPGDPAPGDGSESDPDENGTAEHPYDEIQEAIAGAIFGDTIIVAPGTYFENINLLGKAVTLRSSDGPAVTIIDAGGSGTVVLCTSGEGADTIIDGFTITGGNASEPFPNNRGGGMRIEASSPTVTNCAFIGNSADIGGGMYNADSSPTVSNCTFNGNTAGAGGGMYNFNDSSPMLTNCALSGNTASTGGGMFNSNGSNPTMTHCTVNGNTADGGGGMYNANSSNPTMTHCTVNGNTADGGGGMYNINGSRPTLTHCALIGNSASGSGGAMYNIHGSRPTLTNCMLSGNGAVGVFAKGGGLYNINSSPILTNCTFSGNTAYDGGGMYSIHASHPTLANCIMWNNGENELVNVGRASTTVLWSDVQGGWPGQGNIDADPLFADADGEDDILGTPDDNLRLSPGSPAIDAANNIAVPQGVVTDLDGNPRFVDDPDTPDTGNPDGINPIVDMGAYEFGPPDPCADEDGDGRVTICHIPPGNPDNAHTITVSINALPAHLAHGDHCGACEEDDGLLMGSSSNVTAKPCPTDLDDSGGIGAEDLAQLLGSWGPCARCPADLNGDGVVGAFDLAVLLGAWGLCSE